MGSCMNFKNLGNTSQPDQKPASNYPLARQSSVYSLTFDEFQNTFGGPGKDFGSVNMEDLLKSIWTAEESQALESSSTGVTANVPNGNLQWQGSLTLPRTISQKTVDQVWKDVLKETIGVNSVGSSLGQREPTLGDMTLENFLSKAGVVREDIQPSGSPKENYFYDVSNGNNLGFQQQSQNHHIVLPNHQAERHNIMLNSSNLGINMNGASVMTSSQPQLQPLFPKQTTLTFSSATQIGNNAQLCSPVINDSIVGIKNSMNNNSIVQGGPIVMSGFNNRTVAGKGSPGNNLYSDAIVKSRMDTPPSVSPPVYNYGEVGRGRRSNSSLEKVVERRKRRMIKNRESAARSRARKQAYTLELEVEIEKLKEMNKDLRRKQEEFMDMQNNQIMETMNKPCGPKKRCLRRTLTGPW